MYIRIEATRTETLLVIDEIGRYLGSIDGYNLFMECIDIDLEPLIEDDYIFYLVDKNRLIELLENVS